MKLSILSWSTAFLVALAGDPTPAAAMPITLLSPDPTEHERFGTSVAIVGDKVVVGAPGRLRPEIPRGLVIIRASRTPKTAYSAYPRWRSRDCAGGGASRTVS